MLKRFKSHSQIPKTSKASLKLKTKPAPIQLFKTPYLLHKRTFSTVLKMQNNNNDNQCRSGLHHRVFIVGGATTPFIGKKHPDFIWEKHPLYGKKTNPSLEDIISTTVKNTIDNCSHLLQNSHELASKIDKSFIGNFAGELFNSQGHLGPTLSGSFPELMYKPALRVEGACASGSLAFNLAVEALQNPIGPKKKSTGANICLVIGAEQQTTVSAREGANFLARAAHYKTERELDEFTFPALFAKRNKAYMEKFNVSFEDISRVSVKAYQNANKNPKAHMKAVTLDLPTASTTSRTNPEFLQNPQLQNYLRVSDCSQVSDGGAGLILANEEGLKSLGLSEKDCVEVLVSVLSTGNLFEEADLTRLTTTEQAAKAAYELTDLKPEQMDVAEVHDCFSIAEVLMYEALGFAPYGKGTDLLKEGKTQIEGSIPVNTGGGLIGFGHPVGATGIKQIYEIVRQMNGECDGYQVDKKIQYGICANMGGSDKTSVVTILKNRGEKSLL